MTTIKNAPTSKTTPAPQRPGRKFLFAAVAVTIAVIVALALWLWLPSSSHTSTTVHGGSTVQHVKAGQYDRCAPRPGTRYC
ncbi:MAG TPA: hypothetical protein VGH43_15705 [Jatrophihabitans sp.]|jgi:multidrug resistance efflux pump